MLRDTLREDGLDVQLAYDGLRLFVDLSPAFKVISVVGNKPSLFCACPILYTNYVFAREKKYKKNGGCSGGILEEREREGARARTRSEGDIFVDHVLKPKDF